MAMQAKRARRRKPPPPRRAAGGALPDARRRQGFALLLALVAIAILSVLVTDLHETTGSSFAAAMAERDQLRAEYLAKSGVNLTRMLVPQGRNFKPFVDGLFKALLGRPAPPLPMWQYANMLLKPFSDFEASKADGASIGFNLDESEGLGTTNGSFEVVATAENGKINVNDPRLEDLATAEANLGAQLYSLLGGYQPSPNKYDPLFSQFDDKGRLTNRLDVVANVLDWWDFNEQRANFDPVLGVVTSTGGEDVDYYRTLREPYAIKNAPFDTLEELRLVRGVSDDFWATFVEPDPDDPRTRQITIYGLAKVNPNEADPVVMLARLCAFKELQEQLLCSDPTGQEPLKFVTLLNLARNLMPIPWFSRSSDFVGFVTGKAEGLYGKLSGYLESMGMTAMMFSPMTIEDAELQKSMRRVFTTSARIVTIEVTGFSGRSQKRIRSVINFDDKWTPPPPNPGKAPPLGVFSYFRID